MNATCRLLARSGAWLLCAWLVAGPARAQDAFPSRPIRVIVPQTTGTGGDIYARLMAEKMRQELGQSVVVDNRPGANGVIAMSFLAKQPADGYTLLLAGVSQMAFNQHLYKAAPYDVAKDFTYVAPTVEVPFVLVASKKSGIKNPADLAALAKTKPGGVNFSSGGVGNSTHLAMEMLAVRAGIKASHVPYPGTSGALLSVVSGETDVMVSPLPVALAQINSGGLVPVAVLGAARLAQLPSVPTLKESGLDVPFMPGWYALIGPAGMDQAVAQKLNAAVQKMFSDAEIKAKLDGMSMVVVGGTAAGNRERALSESRTWGELIRAQKLQVE
jgi:tripartite-type tricarboxylate transporter receptor subunit TctC